MAKYHKNKDHLAALIYFREDITEDQARKALQRISPLIEKPFNSDDAGDLVQSYDPRSGGPVWYIP
ncbi:hypothetical protein LCGC14_1783580 [marine sediment metagenome]|uniref:Uncharacterized protein n=1 Tax=marine sediment metagenome TaxID=412755 RepID=A0A0F9GUL6_9ZZZZ